MSTKRQYNPKTGHWETPNRRPQIAMIVIIAVMALLLMVLIGMRNRSTSIGGVDAYGRTTKY